MEKECRMMQKWNCFLGNMSIRKKMIATMIGMVILFTFSLLIYYYEVSTKIILPNTERQIINTLNQAVWNLDANITTLENICYDTSTNTSLQTLLTRSVEIQDGDEFARWDIIRQIDRLLMGESIKLSAIRGFYVFDTKGQSYVVKDTQLNFQIDAIDWERLKAAKGETVWGTPQQASVLFGAVSAPVVVPVGKTIYDLSTQKKIGYLIVFVEVSYLQSITDDIQFGENDIIFLVNEKGDTIPSNVPIEAQKLNFSEGQIVSAEYKNEAKRIADWPTATGSWRLMVVTQDNVHNHELILLRRITVILLIGVGFLALLANILLTRHISSRMMNLVRDMQSFAEGNLILQVSDEYADEIGILQKSFRQMVSDINRLIEGISNEKFLAQQAQLRMLQMQINPHFLYNTLDTISWLAQTHGASDVAEVSRSLGYLMRFSLTEEDLVPLEAEIDAVEHYMLIQKYRYGEQLKIVIQVEEEALYEKVPCHILLPLIENAIEHGLKNKIGEKEVHVRGWLCDDHVMIHISDNGIGMSSEKIQTIMEGNNLESGQNLQKHMSIGLRNVNRRIQLRYGKKHGLQISSVVGEGTTVRLCIPCRKESMEELENQK